MVMPILAKVEVEKSSIQKSIWQFYMRIGLEHAGGNVFNQKGFKSVLLLIFTPRSGVVLDCIDF